MLHHVAEQGHVHVTHLLLQHGANVNSKDMSGNTALHRAAYNNNVELVKLLFDRGVDIECADDSGSTLLHRAVMKKA